MPRPSRSTLMSPMSAQSSLSHCTTTRPGMEAGSSGTTQSRPPSQITMPPECRPKCRSRSWAARHSSKHLRIRGCLRSSPASRRRRSSASFSSLNSQVATAAEIREASFVIIGFRRNPPEWRYRLGVRTEDSQSSNTGSIPVSATKVINNLLTRSAEACYIPAVFRASLKCPRENSNVDDQPLKGAFDLGLTVSLKRYPEYETMKCYPEYETMRRYPEYETMKRYPDTKPVGATACMYLMEFHAGSTSTSTDSFQKLSDFEQTSNCHRCKVLQIERHDVATRRSHSASPHPGRFCSS
jgi:hypothetical protein